MPSGASGGIRLTCTRHLGYGRGACHSVRFQPPKAQIGRRSTRRRPHTSTTTNVAIAPNTRLRTSSLFFIEMPSYRNSDAPFDSRGYIGRDVPRARRAEQESGNRSRSAVSASNPWRHVIRSTRPTDQGHQDLDAAWGFFQFGRAVRGEALGGGARWWASPDERLAYSPSGN